MFYLGFFFILVIIIFDVLFVFRKCLKEKENKRILKLIYAFNVLMPMLFIIIAIYILYLNGNLDIAKVNNILLFGLNLMFACVYLYSDMFFYKIYDKTKLYMCLLFFSLIFEINTISGDLFILIMYICNFILMLLVCNDEKVKI